MTERNSGQHEDRVKNYYNHSINETVTEAGAGFIWFLGQDHLSPMLSNIDEFALDSTRWREGISNRVAALLKRMGIKLYHWG